ncbi:MAG: hypothetical protein Ta2F_01340 [Termitinemataceae bacterium]|nr:MAG: hypothetical protein Ta2F_01340 [Termitinemataceae bacterium]
MDEQQQQVVYKKFQDQGWLPVGVESYTVFKNYDEVNLLSEKSAVIVTAWSPETKGLYKIIDGYLCAVYFIKGRDSHFTVYSSSKEIPVTKQIIDTLYQTAISNGLPQLLIGVIENRYLNFFKNIQGYNIETWFDQGDSDHSYKIENLICLDGSKNYYKRKRINLYCDRDDIRLEKMTNQNVKICAEIQKKWCEERAGDVCNECGSFYGCEKNAINTMVRLFDENIHDGLIGYEGDVPIGYIVTEKINKDVSYLYFGKGLDNDFFIYLIYMIYKNNVSDCDYMNMGEDLGDPGLRFFKRKLSISELWERHYCSYKKQTKK